MSSQSVLFLIVFETKPDFGAFLAFVRLQIVLLTDFVTMLYILILGFVMVHKIVIAFDGELMLILY